jgi:hypothetical protein
MRVIDRIGDWYLRFAIAGALISILFVSWLSFPLAFAIGCAIAIGADLLYNLGGRKSKSALVEGDVRVPVEAPAPLGMDSLYGDVPVYRGRVGLAVIGVIFIGFGGYMLIRTHVTHHFGPGEFPAIEWAIGASCVAFGLWMMILVVRRRKPVLVVGFEGLVDRRGHRFTWTDIKDVQLKVNTPDGPQSETLVLDLGSKRKRIQLSSDTSGSDRPSSEIYDLIRDRWERATGRRRDAFEDEEGVFDQGGTHDNVWNQSS